MKDTYMARPEETWLEVLNRVPGGTAIAHFNENIQKVTFEDETEGFTADHYSLETVYRDGLETSIRENRDAWLKAAKEAEETGNRKTELEIMQESMEALKDANESLNASVDMLTMAILEGGV